MNNFPQIKTERLILGSLSYHDIPKIIEYAGNVKIAQTTLNIPHPYAEKDAIWWINNVNQGFENKIQYTFAIRLKSTQELIGSIGLKVNKVANRGVLGYWIGVPFWNSGYATEATSGILAFGFEELRLNKIYATHLEENPASGKVMKKNGMIKEGELREHTRKGEVYHSLIQYRLTKAEFDALY